MHDARHDKRSDGGFTLVELTIVLLLLSILLLIAVASFMSSSNRASEAACLSNQRTLSTAITMYRSDSGAAPESFDDLRPYARDVERSRYCPEYDTELTLDTTTDQVTCVNHPR